LVKRRPGRGGCLKKKQSCREKEANIKLGEKLRKGVYKKGKIACVAPKRSYQIELVWKRGNKGGENQRDRVLEKKS